MAVFPLRRVQDNGIIKVYGILEWNAAYKRIKGEKKMNYPDVYSEIDANEMVYIVGGSPDYMGLFNYLIGNYLRDAVLSDARSAVWNSAKKGSLTPMEDWMKNFWNMNIFAKTGYLYGVFRLGETIMGYLNK